MAPAETYPPLCTTCKLRVTFSGYLAGFHSSFFTHKMTFQSFFFLPLSLFGHIDHPDLRSPEGRLRARVGPKSPQWPHAQNMSHSYQCTLIVSLRMLTILGRWDVRRAPRTDIDEKNFPNY